MPFRSTDLSGRSVSLGLNVSLNVKLDELKTFSMSLRLLSSILLEDMSQVHYSLVRIGFVF